VSGLVEPFELEFMQRALLEITLLAPAYDANGNATYSPATPSELVNVNGWNTFA